MTNRDRWQDRSPGDGGRPGRSCLVNPRVAGVPNRATLIGHEGNFRTEKKSGCHRPRSGHLKGEGDRNRRGGAGRHNAPGPPGQSGSSQRVRRFSRIFRGKSESGRRRIAAIDPLHLPGDSPPGCPERPGRVGPFVLDRAGLDRRSTCEPGKGSSMCTAIGAPKGPWNKAPPR